MDDTKTRIISAAMRAVRRYGLEGVRIQNVSRLAGVSPGALYRYFHSKEQLLTECFTCVDQQAAAIFDHLKFDPRALLSDPLGAVRSLWSPYFRFWTSHPDETVFYYRFRESAAFPQFYRTLDTSYFQEFANMVHLFMEAFPALRQINQDVLWLHVLTCTLLYAKCVVEGLLPNTRETEDTVFQFLTVGLGGYLRSAAPEQPQRAEGCPPL